MPDVAFAKVDVDQLQQVAQSQKVSAMPTFVAYSFGKEMGRVRGANAAGVEEMLRGLQAQSAAPSALKGAALPAGQSDLTSSVNTKQAGVLVRMSRERD